MQDGDDVGERFNNLAADARERLQESEEDLRNATDVLNRTCQLQITAQQQLLRVESKLVFAKGTPILIANTREAQTAKLNV